MNYENILYPTMPGLFYMWQCVKMTQLKLGANIAYTYCSSCTFARSIAAVNELWGITTPTHTDGINLKRDLGGVVPIEHRTRKIRKQYHVL